MLLLKKRLSLLIVLFVFLFSRVPARAQAHQANENTADTDISITNHLVSFCQNVLVAPAKSSWATCSSSTSGSTSTYYEDGDGLMVSWNTHVLLSGDNNTDDWKDQQRYSAGPATVHWGYHPNELSFRSVATSSLIPNPDPNPAEVSIVHNVSLPFQKIHQKLYFQIQPPTSDSATSSSGNEGTCQQIYEAMNLLQIPCPRFSMFGDLGWSNNQIFDLTRSQTHQGDLDAIVLFGDMVYYWGQEEEEAVVEEDETGTRVLKKNYKERSSFLSPQQQQQYALSSKYHRNTLYFMQNLSLMTMTPPAPNNHTATQSTSTIDPSSATRIIPLMVSAGNGENFNSFSDYASRFFMPCNPGQEHFCKNQWYSLNIGGSATDDGDGDDNDKDNHGSNTGGVHLIALSSEVLGYWPSLPPQMKYRMMQWLRQDLREANLLQNRRRYPWIVIHYHRPSYSSWGDPENDSKPYDTFEELFLKYHVDAVFAGHVHNMELTTPIARNESLMTTATQQSSRANDALYIYNATAPVYVVAGNPSNYESTSFFEDSRDWTLWRSYMFGHATMAVGPATPQDEILTIEFVHSATNQIAHRATLAKPKQFDGRKNDNRDGNDAALGDGNLYATPQNERIRQLSSVDASCSRNIGLRQLPVGSVVAKNDGEGGTDTGTPGSSSLEFVPWAQAAALKEIYNALGGPSWLHKKGWENGGNIHPFETPTRNNPCKWYGVTCESVVDQMLPDEGAGVQYGITALMLPSNNLHGDITYLEDAFTALGMSLQILDLSSNHIYGTLFDLERAFPRVHTIALSPWSSSTGATISGPLSLPRKTRYAFLERTHLSGTLPEVVGRLPCASGGTMFRNVGCLLWLMDVKNVTGRVPGSVCSGQYNEIYLHGTQVSGGPCLRNVTSYCQQPYGNCTNCKKVSNPIENLEKS